MELAVSTTVNRRIAVVQWTHTLHMKNALLLARAQLSRASSFDHHVVLQSCGEKAPSCDKLRHGLLPLTENVSCFSATDMLRIVPALQRLGNASNMTGRWSSQSFPKVGQFRWCWFSCDAAYIAWYLTLQPRYDFYWFLEWDVVWTGNLATLLAAWNGNRRIGGNEPRYVEHDLTCPDPVKQQV